MKTNVFKKVGDELVNVIIGFFILVTLIRFCPITPIVWLIIHANTLVWIWLAVTIILTAVLIYSLAKDSAWKDNDEMFD
jgi:hypothetical protein